MPPWGEIEKWALSGGSDEEIADALGRKSLSRRIRRRLKQWRALRQLRLRGKQHELAMEGSVPLLTWLGKCYLGQSPGQCDNEDVEPEPELDPKVG